MSFALASLLLSCGLPAAPAFAAPGEPLPSRATIEREYVELLATFDRKVPGKGPDVLHFDRRPVPTAFTSILRAEGLRWKRTRRRSALRRMRRCGRWLLDHSDENRNGIVGWGLPAEFARTGGIVPKHEEYTVTTAGVTGVLMDWMKMDRGAPRREIISLVRRAFAPYLARPPKGRTLTGFFAYSFFQADLRHDVYNVGAYIAGHLQRFSLLVRDRPYKRRLRAAADKQIGVLIKARLRSPRGNYYWRRTSRPSQRPNELGHALITVGGLRYYWRYGGKRGRRALKRSKLLGHVTEFIDDRVLYTSPVWEGRREERAVGSAGVTGAVVFAMRERPLRRLLPFFIRRLRSYEFAPGRYATGLTEGPRSTIRGQAGVLGTFARYLWDRKRPYLVN